MLLIEKGFSYDIPVINNEPGLHDELGFSPDGSTWVDETEGKIEIVDFDHSMAQLRFLKEPNDYAVVCPREMLLCNWLWVSFRKQLAFLGSFFYNTY